jgi:single-stranded DNA-binding protein
MTMRKMQIAGRVGQSPEFDTYQGTPVANLSVATERYHDDDTVWVSVTVWGSKAEFVRDYIDKGDAVVAHGAPATDAYESKGEAQASLTLDADGLEPMNIRADGGNGGGSSRDFSDDVPDDTGDSEAFDDEEIPF